MNTAGTPSPRRFRAWCLNAAVLVISTVIAVGIAEFLARKFVDVSGWPPFYVGEFDNRPSHNFVDDPHTGWRMRGGHTFAWQIGAAQEENAYISNAAGFRSNHEFSRQGAIALVGDSFTFGTGVAYEQTFGALLEARLGEVPVYNFAMPGFGLDQMLLAIQHQILPLHPRLIVVAFIDEDFERSLTAYRKVEGFNKPSYVVEHGKLRLRTRADQPPAFITYLRRNLVLAGAMSQNMQQLGRVLPLGSWWTINAAILQQIALVAREQGVPVLFIRLPAPEQREFATLSAHMNSVGAHFLDMEEQTRGHAEQEIFIPGDGHINAHGHALVADAILNWIKANPAALTQ